MAKIALLGLGVVASGVPEILAHQSGKIKQLTGNVPTISKALVYNEAEAAAKADVAEKYGIDLVLDIAEVTGDAEIDIVVELIGRIDTARDFITQALNAGKHVVTANKDLLATYGSELKEIAQKNGVNLYYEAAVAGGIPILRTLANSLDVDCVTEVLGILNGTTNYMLTQMKANGVSYAEALKEAQDLGYAESDPRNDVEGIDAGYKVAILSDFAFGVPLTIDDIDCHGIANVTAGHVLLADEFGYEIKLVGRAKKVGGNVFGTVRPAFVSKRHVLSSVSNAMNAVFVYSENVGMSMYYGPGAGSLPTANSVVADIVKIAQNIENGVPAAPFNRYQKAGGVASKGDVKSDFYVVENHALKRLENITFAQAAEYAVAYPIID
ncbi:MAG: homoserine dehydrogenase [Lactobacillales bacterium]|jgi:homoserine dehydrogenase|nr:homoserine dehydrogenase [Lactobacillales bacterium]